MKAPRLFHIFFRSSLIFLACFVRDLSANEDVDLIFLNGNIYTVNEKQPHAEAIAVKKDRIVFVGSNTDAKKINAARTIDLAGKTVLPGWWRAPYFGRAAVCLVLSCNWSL